MGVRIWLFDRRKGNRGPPRGHERRRQSATGTSKMACPKCGCDESAVLRSKPLTSIDAYRRQRVCATCGKVFPTREEVDWVALERDERSTGRTLTRNWRLLWRF